MSARHEKPEAMAQQIDHREEKTSIDMEKKDIYQDGQLQMPTALAALSEAEYNKIGKSATWKMDLLILPSLVIMYIMNYLDRQNIAAARLANLQRDLNLTAVQYQTCVSILFVGYSESCLHPTCLTFKDRS